MLTMLAQPSILQPVYIMISFASYSDRSSDERDSFKDEYTLIRSTCDAVYG